MSRTFLCESHRARLGADPHIALMRWEEWMLAGQQALAESDSTSALRFLGSSFEVGELLLRGKACLSDDDVDRYMVSGHYLAECFSRCGSPDLCRHYLLAVHYQLLKLLRSPEGRHLRLKGNIEFSLQMLERAYHGEAAQGDLRRCREESLRHLARHYH